MQVLPIDPVAVAPRVEQQAARQGLARMGDSPGLLEIGQPGFVRDANLQFPESPVTSAGDIGDRKTE